MVIDYKSNTMFVMDWFAYVFFRCYTSKKRGVQAIEDRARSVLSWMIAFSSGALFHLMAGLIPKYRDFYLINPFALLLCPLIVGAFVYRLVSKRYTTSKFVKIREKYGEDISIGLARLIVGITTLIFYVFTLSLLLISVYII